MNILHKTSMLHKISMKAMLSLLILGTNVGVNAGFSDLFAPPSTSEIIYKYVKKTGKWATEQFKASAKYVPGAVVSILATCFAYHIANTIKDDYIKPAYANIKAIYTNYKEAQEVQKIKAELADKVKNTPDKDIKITKKQYDTIIKYAKSLQEQDDYIVKKTELENTLKNIDELQKDVSGKTATGKA